MEIVLFGEDHFPKIVMEALIDRGHKIQLIVSRARGSQQTLNPLRDTASHHDISFLESSDVNSVELERRIRELKPDLIVCVHLKRLLKKRIFEIPKYGSINIHPSLLPKYRGLSPLHQALIHGDSESAVTVHFIDEDIDTGNIILQERFDIRNDDYIFDLYLKIRKIYRSIVPSAIERIINGDFGSNEVTTEENSVFGPLKKKDREIDLLASTVDAYNLIRAVSKPFNGAYYGDFIVWTSTMNSTSKDEMYRKKYEKTGIYLIENESTLLIVLNDGSLVSDDFEWAS